MSVQQSDLIDPALATEVDLARAAAQEEAGDERVGDYVSYHVEDEAAVTHLFEADKPGYHGWRWAVTITSAGPATDITVSEVVLLPGPSALVAPDWIPWQRRVQAGDLGVGDLLPTDPDDPRLVPAYLYSDDPVIEETATEAGLGRARVMSRPARVEAAERWQQSEFGPRSDMARSAPAHCGTCGFYLPLAGSLRAAFGTCGNELSPADAHVVHAEYGCGAHSEADVEQVSPVLVADLIYDDAQLDVEPLTVVDEIPPPAEAIAPAAGPTAAAPTTEAPAPTTEPEPAAAPEATTQPETAAEPEKTAEPGTVTQPEATTQPEAVETATVPETATEPAAIAQSEATAQPEAATELVAVTEPEMVTQSEAIAQPEAGERTPVPEATTEPAAVTEPETIVQPEAVAEPAAAQPEAATESEPAAQTEPVAQAEPIVEPQAPGEPQAAEATVLPVAPEASEPGTATAEESQPATAAAEGALAEPVPAIEPSAAAEPAEGFEPAATEPVEDLRPTGLEPESSVEPAPAEGFDPAVAEPVGDIRPVEPAPFEESATPVEPSSPAPIDEAAADAPQAKSATTDADGFLPTAWVEEPAGEPESASVEPVLTAAEAAAPAEVEPVVRLESKIEPAAEAQPAEAAPEPTLAPEQAPEAALAPEPAATESGATTPVESASSAFSSRGQGWVPLGQVFRPVGDSPLRPRPGVPQGLEPRRMPSFSLQVPRALIRRAFGPGRRNPSAGD